MSVRDERRAGRSSSRSLARRPATRLLSSLGGPLLIVVAVLVVLNHFAFGGLVSRQYPDVLPFWLPTYCFLGKSLAAGHIPAWNPHVMGGIPFAGDPQSGWMYLPPMILFAALRCDVAFRWFIVLQPLLAGLGMYAFLRSEELSRPAATVGGLALSMPLAGSYLSLNLPFAATMAWTAVTLALLSRYIRATTWPGRLGWLAGAGIAWMQLAASNLSDGLLIGSSALAAYVITRLVSDVRSGKRTPRGALGLAGLLVLAFPTIGLAYFLPRLAYLPRTSIGLGYRALYFRSRWLTWSRAFGLEFGTGVGPTWPLRLALSPGVYLGATPLALIFAGWRATARRSLDVGFAIYGAICYVLMLQWVAHGLPSSAKASSFSGFYFHDPSRFRFGLLVSLGVLAGLGVQGWLDARSWRERALLLAPGLVVWGILPWALGAGTIAPLIWFGAAGGAVALVLAVHGPRLGALIPLVLGVELVTNGLLGQVHHYVPPPGNAPGDRLNGPINTLLLPTVNATDYIQPTRTIRYLRSAGLGRYLSSDPSSWDPRGYHIRQPRRYWGLLGMQQSMLFGESPQPEEGQGYNPAQELRYWSFVRAVERKAIRYNAALFVHTPPVAVNLLQVEWIVARTGGGGVPYPGATPALRDGLWTVYRVPDPVPRASLVSSWRVVATADQALAVVRSPGFDPNRRVVLERAPGIAPEPSAAAASGPTGSATFRWEGPQAATVSIDAASPSVVLVRNSYDPGWHATVDGRPAEVLAADSIDQAVAVGAGRHVIRLTYDDPSVGYGLAGSAVSVTALGSVAVLLRRRRRRAGL